MESCFFVDIVVQKQQSDWDCGLACVRSILKSLFFNTLDFDQLEREIATRSIWTIDLLFLLEHYGVHAKMYTQTIGVTSTHHEMDFYKSELDIDEIRVNSRFESASSKNIIHRGSLSQKELISLLRSNYVALVLVDSRILQGKSGSYYGHFVVICGFCVARKSYVVMNPGYNELKEYNADLLDKARKAKGTDEDVILIPLPEVRTKQEGITQDCNICSSSRK
eukprot:TRINITY_DN19970_c0_g1_i1.p1 TRINITY_DN19970_c0_g1~~TRINITY_DN19970_c0_g1_i1.p1  ORF type:complete len:222 (-),score=32.55 TRINITY_DN19970_c0_g1_i1:20-685(-)